MIKWGKIKLFVTENWKLLAAALSALVGTYFVYDRNRRIKENAKSAIDASRLEIVANKKATDTIVQETKKVTETYVDDVERVKNVAKVAIVAVEKKKDLEVQELVAIEASAPGSLARDLAREFGATYVEPEENKDN